MNKSARVLSQGIGKISLRYKRPPKGGLSLTGFTFIEMMVVAVLTAIIGLGLTSTFQAGMNVWKRVSSPRYAHRKAVLELERLFKELRSVYFYIPLKFFGQEDRIIFVNVGDNQIYHIQYYYSQKDKCMYRSRRTKQEVVRKVEPVLRKIITGVKSFSFSYEGVYFTRQGPVYWKGSYWKTRWGIPRAVRVVLTLEDGSRFEKNVLLPIANSGFWAR